MNKNVRKKNHWMSWLIKTEKFLIAGGEMSPDITDIINETAGFHFKGDEEQLCCHSSAQHRKGIFHPTCCIQFKGVFSLFA